MLLHFLEQRWETIGCKTCKLQYVLPPSIILESRLKKREEGPKTEEFVCCTGSHTLHYMLSQHLHCRAETNESNSLTPAFSPASLSGLSWCCMVAVQPRKLPLGNQTTDEALIRNSDMQHVIWGVRPDDRVDKLSLLSGQNLQSGNRIVSAAAMIASPSLKLICNYKSMRCSPAYSDNSTVQRLKVMGKAVTWWIWLTGSPAFALQECRR